MKIFKHTAVMETFDIQGCEIKITIESVSPRILESVTDYIKDGLTAKQLIKGGCSTCVTTDVVFSDESEEESA